LPYGCTDRDGLNDDGLFGFEIVRPNDDLHEGLTEQATMGRRNGDQELPHGVAPFTDGSRRMARRSVLSKYLNGMNACSTSTPR
jgi:hypothetical protein